MITIWHNPRCSKSRQTLALIQASGKPYTIRLYLVDAPALAELEQARKALGAPRVIDMMRPGEKIFAELALSEDTPDADLLAAMAAHPILIERPLVLAADRAVIGRPPENVNALL